jgi:glycerol kinase
MLEYILSIDQGTTSTRAIIFDHEARIVATGQLEHRQIFPRAGWVEHDPISGTTCAKPSAWP